MSAHNPLFFFPHRQRSEKNPEKFHSSVFKRLERSGIQLSLPSRRRRITTRGPKKRTFHPRQREKGRRSAGAGATDPWRRRRRRRRDDITLARGVGHETRSTWRRRIPSVPIDARNLHLNHARLARVCVCVYIRSISTKSHGPRLVNRSPVRGRAIFRVTHG